MYGNVQIPSGRRSPTASPGQSDYRDDLIYSSIVVQHGGTSSQKLFTVPQGQAILIMGGSSTAPTQAHHKSHTELTTNLDKAGELGAGIGDALIRAISIVLEEAPPLSVSGSEGTYATFGATPQDVCDFVAKTYFQLKVGGKTMIQGPVSCFPSQGGALGSIAIGTTANNVKLLGGLANNGRGAKVLKIPIQLGRSDTLQGVLATGNAATYSFHTASGYGQETLVTCVLSALVRGDVR